MNDEKNRRKEDQRPAQQLDWSGFDPAHVEALAESMLRCIYQRPDLTQMGREQFIRDMMDNREELTVGGGDFRNMARTALAGIDEQLYGLIDRLGDRLVMMAAYLSDTDRAKFESTWNDHLRQVRMGQHSTTATKTVGQLDAELASARAEAEARATNRAAAEKVAFSMPPGVRDALHPAYVMFTESPPCAHFAKRTGPESHE